MKIGYMIFPSPLIFTRKELFELKLTSDYLNGYIDILPVIFEYESFSQEIIKSRNNLGIPETGLELEEYQTLMGLTDHGWYSIIDRLENPFNKTNYREDLQNNTITELSRINKLFTLNKLVKRQLPHVLLGNTFIPIGMRFAYSMNYHPQTKRPYYFDISIMYEVKKEEFLAFIDKEWDLIAAELKKLPGGRKSKKPPKLVPEDLEMRVIELVDAGLPRKDISEIINNEFHQYKNENTISQINSRSKKLLGRFIRRT